MPTSHPTCLFSMLLVQLVTIYSIVKAEDPELEFNYLPIAHVRTDPIISSTCLSDHVHTFYGPPLVRPEVTTDDLINTKASEHSGLVKENKSLYWHPTIYKYNTKTKTFIMDEIYFTSIYYTWNADEKTYSFPRGFRMIAKEKGAFTKCVKGKFFRCSRSDGCSSKNKFFPKLSCNLLEITMNFPTCWDGRTDSPDHKSHIVYADEDDDSCPKTHKKRIPTLTISIHIKNYDGGYHTWSDMTSEFHTDYLSGWDVSLMDKFIQGCQTDTENCHEYVTFKNGPVGDDSSDEKHKKLMKILPPLPDTLSTISSEPVDNVVGDLPSGLCTGTLIPPNSSSNPTPAPTSRKPPLPKGCYSNNFRDCLPDEYESKIISYDTLWLPLGARNSDCVPLWGDCTGDDSNCCQPATCYGDKDTSASCVPPEKKISTNTPTMTPDKTCGKKKDQCKKNADCCKKKCVRKKCKK